MVFTCGDCGFVAVYPSRLRRHQDRCLQRRGSGPPLQDPYACIHANCGYRSRTQAHVRRHIKNCRHREGGNSVQEYCASCKAYVKNLESHVKAQHPTTSPFKTYKLAFNGKVRIVRRTFPFGLSTTPKFEETLKNELQRELEALVLIQPTYQAQVTLRGALIRPGQDDQPLHVRLEDDLISHSSSSFQPIIRGDNMKEKASSLVEHALESLDSFLVRGSGFDCSHILSCDLHSLAVGTTSLKVGAMSDSSERC